MSEDSDFDGEWKEKVETKVTTFAMGEKCMHKKV